MTKIKTEDLEGAALDWAVVEASKPSAGHTDKIFWMPSINWSQGGPIIEREKLAVVYRAGGYWLAYTFDGAVFEGTGPTPLVAAMRCYVAAKMGEEIDMPDELIGG